MVRTASATREALERATYAVWLYNHHDVTTALAHVSRHAQSAAVRALAAVEFENALTRRSIIVDAYGLLFADMLREEQAATR